MAHDLDGNAALSDDSLFAGSAIADSLVAHLKHSRCGSRSDSLSITFQAEAKNAADAEERKKLFSAPSGIKRARLCAAIVGDV